MIEITCERGNEERIEDALKRFKLVDNTLPVKAIRVTMFEHRIMVHVEMLCLDIVTREPKRIIFGNMVGASLPFYGDITPILGHAIREAMRYAVAHEIDEVLMCDNKQFTDPHPEQCAERRQLTGKA